MPSSPTRRQSRNTPMGKVWCAGLPVVTAPRCDTPKRLTLVYPYYENPVFLARQLDHLGGLAPDLRKQVSLIVVDDGSPEHPALTVAQRYPTGTLRLFEIEVDKRWNWLAARNIGLDRASDGWVLVTDMDHVVTEEAMRGVLYGAHDPEVIYGFSRIDAVHGPIPPHPNSWLITRAMFWKVGGYDETLSGHYGTDGDWRRRCAATAPMHILTDALVRYEFVDDSSTTRYRRKQPEDAAVKQLIAARGKGWRPKVLSFPYREVC